MSDTGSPNDTEHLLISNRSIEKLQNLVDTEVKRNGVVDEWPEHWQESGAVEVWKCHSCYRLYLSPRSHPDQIAVYVMESAGH